MLEQKPKLEIDSKYLPLIKKEDNVLKIDAEGLYYRDLNCLLRQAICADGIEKIEIQNVCGQRYIGTDLTQTSKSTFTEHLETTLAPS